MSSSSYVGYAAGISAVSNIFQSIAATSALKSQLKADTNAKITNASNTVDTYAYQRELAIENINNLNQVLGDKMSERGLTRLKETALLKAASAETGTTGGTTDYATQEAFLTEQMDKANIKAQGNQQLKQLYSNMESNTLNTRNKIDSILIGGGVSIETNPLLQGIQGGLSIATNTIGLLPDSEKAKLFGIVPEKNVLDNYKSVLER